MKDELKEAIHITDWIIFHYIHVVLWINEWIWQQKILLLVKIKGQIQQKPFILIFEWERVADEEDPRYKFLLLYKYIYDGHKGQGIWNK